jgi:multiple sugar transport system ATP-binding protein
MAVQVALRDVSVSFGAVKVIENLNLEVTGGEFLVLLGPSGCGKSTLLNAVAGLTDVRAGQIWIGDRNLTWTEPSDRNIGMVFQSYALYPQMTVRGNLSFGLRMTGTKKDVIEDRVRVAAEMLHLTEFLERKPRQLSGGQRQRVAIGRALVREASVFLFDEPLSNLDAKLRTELRGELKRLHQDLDATMIYVTHDQIEAMTLGDRIAVMDRGRIQQIGKPTEIYLRPANRFVAGFIGSLDMNFFNGTLQGAGAERRFVGDGFELSLAAYDFKAAPGGNGQNVALGIRPEHITTGRWADEKHRRSGAIESVTPLGAENLVKARLGNASISMLVNALEHSETASTVDFDVHSTPFSIFDEKTGQRL